MDLNLRDRTIVILGPSGPTLQNLVISLTQHGANVALVDEEAEKMQRFCQTVTDQREVNEKFGRAIAIPVQWNSLDAIRDGLGRATQSFGGLDIFIDALCESKPSAFNVGGENPSIEKWIHQNLTVSLRATEFVAPFLKGRKRGRIIYLLQDSMNRHLPEDAVAAAARTGLIAFSKNLARQFQDVNVTVNCLSLGLTEEYLQGHFPDCASVREALEKMKLLDPSYRITDSEKIANSILYLASSSGASLTGQHLILS